MWSLDPVAVLEDGGGRRSGLDRRSFLIPGGIPERRSTQDRRSGRDRRIRKEDFRNLIFSFEPRRLTDKHVEFLGSMEGLFRGIFFGAILWEVIIISILFIRTI